MVVGQYRIYGINMKFIRQCVQLIENVQNIVSIHELLIDNAHCVQLHGSTLTIGGFDFHFNELKRMSIATNGHFIRQSIL